MHFLFDVDGTMTPSRQKIDMEFRRWFEHFATHHAVYFVTGSDRDKTIQQLGQSIYNLAIRCYQCNGNDVWEQNNNIRTNKFNLAPELREDLERELKCSKFYNKTGIHIEERPGLINFSIPGRRANLETRSMYKQWDQHKGERVSIAARMRIKWPNYSFEIAGETGIDITMSNSGKEQILSDFDLQDPIRFFGDSCQQGGNDYTLAQALTDRPAKVYHVADWKQTWDILKRMVND